MNERVTLVVKTSILIYPSLVNHLLEGVELVRRGRARGDPKLVEHSLFVHLLTRVLPNVQGVLLAAQYLRVLYSQKQLTSNIVDDQGMDQVSLLDLVYLIGEMRHISIIYVAVFIDDAW